MSKVVYDDKVLTVLQDKTLFEDGALDPLRRALAEFAREPGFDGVKVASIRTGEYLEKDCEPFKAKALSSWPGGALRMLTLDPLDD